MNKKRRNSHPNIAKKICFKIESTLREKRMNKYELAEKIGVSKQTISHIILKLKDGEFPKLSILLDIEKILEIRLIFFEI